MPKALRILIIFSIIEVISIELIHLHASNAFIANFAGFDKFVFDSYPTGHRVHLFRAIEQMNIFHISHAERTQHFIL